MGRYRFSEDDLKRGTVVKPAWYNAEIHRLIQEPAKDGSNNDKITFKITDGDFAGVTIPAWFNEKDSAQGFVQPLIKALANGKIEPNKDYDITPQLVGRKLKIYVINDKYNERMTNKISDYAPIGA